MNYKILFETIVHLKPIQVMYQMLAKVSHPQFRAVKAPDVSNVVGLLAPIPKNVCCSGNDFTFLNIKDSFHSWNQTNHGMLWAYNLNYMDWLWQEGMGEVEGEKWIDKFVEDLPQNHVGQDPYPIALRSINWIKFFHKSPNSATRPRLDSLYSQILLLEKKLEYKLLGNHLLEDAYSLYIASIYFNDQKLYAKASKLLKNQLNEQVLADGAHYEQSPMYHCILLDRLLDCVNFALHTDFTETADIGFLKGTAERMLGHLESIIWENGSIPLLNDSAFGIAPSAEQLFDYAKRLGLHIPMKESGYRKLKNERLEAIVDVGNITASYQPGHTHADTFSYELRIDGKPFIVDTGISTYNKSGRRQYERSTLAHNTVSVDGKNSSEVWGGFRVGKRASVTLKNDESSVIEAVHNGFEKDNRRRFEMKGGAFVVEDWYDGEAESYIHLAEGADEKRVLIEGAQSVEVKPCQYSIEYNRFLEGKVIDIRFKDNCRYTIK